MIGHLLNADLVVYRPSYSADGRGGRSKSFAELDTIRGQVCQATAQERLVASQLGAKLTHVVYAAAGVDVDRGDELDDGGARRLRVVDVLADSRATYTRLECVVVEGG